MGADAFPPSRQSYESHSFPSVNFSPRSTQVKTLSPAPLHHQVERRRVVVLSGPRGSLYGKKER